MVWVLTIVIHYFEQIWNLILFMNKKQNWLDHDPFFFFLNVVLKADLLNLVFLVFSSIYRGEDSQTTSDGCI